jgi:hypothetical protein
VCLQGLISLSALFAVGLLAIITVSDSLSGYSRCPSDTANLGRRIELSMEHKLTPPFNFIVVLQQ